MPFNSYKYLRFLTILAGLLGAAQALSWLGLSVTALISYNCNIDFTGFLPNFGNILRFTLFHMYFRGDCTPTGWPQVDFTALDNIDLMTPDFVYIWMWVVAALSLVWLFSSVTLITSVKKSTLSYFNVILYSWIFITFVICIIDLLLFIYFIIDYYNIMQESYNVSLNFAVSTSSILLSAQNTSGMLASLALRGYLLWLINLTLVIYFFTQTFKVYDYNKTSGISKSGQMNKGFKSDNELRGHSIFNNQPIHAYEANPGQVQSPWYNYLTTEIPRVQRPQSIYPAPLVRSRSVTNLDEAYQRRTYHQQAQHDDVILRRDQMQKELKSRQSVNNGLANFNQVPTPTSQQNPYEPRPQLRSAMRNSRYN